MAQKLTELKSKRIQLDLDPEEYEQLQQLKERCKARTFQEVLRKSLNLYDWCLDAMQKREKILIVSQDGTSRELLVL